MEPDKNNFLERLSLVLGSKRKRHAWGRSLGFTDNRVHRLFKSTEQFPSTEELAIIGVAENLNLNWLVYGLGSPYRVQVFQQSDRLNEAITQLLREKWDRTYLIVSRPRFALYTWRSQIMRYKGRNVSVKLTDCLIGSADARLRKMVGQSTEIQGLEIPTYIFEQLEDGELGTHYLLGDKKSYGYLEELEPKEVQSLLSNLPLIEAQSRTDLACLVDCYGKIKTFQDTTGQQLSAEKITELTWVLYQTEISGQTPLEGEAQVSSALSSSSIGNE